MGKSCRKLLHEILVGQGGGDISQFKKGSDWWKFSIWNSMMGSQPIRIHLGKILREKSCGKILWENLVGNSCRKILWEIVVGKSCGKNLQEIVVGKSCRKLLWENLAGKSCRKSCGKSYRKFLQENLAGNLTGNSCGKCCGKFPIPISKPFLKVNFQNMQFIQIYLIFTCKC